ncbi:MAG: hypothetical protein IJ173_09865 [Kiritimatiellae bacterium]|nr:hypothetical protein [Kiritimatiellia bacterium]
MGLPGIEPGTYGLGIAIGSGATPSSTAGTITIGANASATIASGKTWTAGGGIVVAASGSLTVAGTAASAITDNGTLTLGDAATVSGAISGSGEVVCTVLPDNAGLADSSGWTGTVTVNGVAVASVAAQSATQFMNANSKLVVAAPTGVVMPYVWLTSASGLTGEVSVQDTATLHVADDTSSTISLKVGTLDGTGTINLGSCVATTLNLSLGTKRPASARIVYPTGLTTLNIAATELLSEDGAATFSVAGLSSLTTTTMTLTKLDGTTESVTGTVSGNTISFEWTPSVSGAACWCAYEMEYDSANSKTGFENSGSDTTDLHSDSNIEESDAFTDDGMLYTYAHPWRDITYPTDGNWTAVVRCTVPAYENAAVITFGTRTGGLIGLVAGADPETQMKLVKTTGDSAFTTLATMTVQNATTAQHVYVFSVETNQTIKVYCDGEQVLNETYSTFTLGGGILVGSVHGGVGSTGIVRFAKDESPANTLSETVQKAARIDCVRLYKTVLGPNAIAALTEEFPAVKLYRATVAADATTTWDALTWSPTWDGGNEYSKIILTTEGDATLTLPDSITADEFTINVASDSTLALAKAAGGTTMTVSKLEIDDGTVAVADANFFGSRAINGTGTLKITTTGALTSALSGNAKVEIPSGVAIGVTTGSIANTITGAGTLTYVLALPATAPTFSGWTGTVQLPAIATDVAINFNNYGIAGSTVAITSMTAGWIANAEVLPEINLVGNMTLNYFSGNWANTFDKLSGVGTFTLAADGTTDGYVNNYFLIKDVSDFTGSISVAAPGLAIGAAKPESPETYGQIYLTTSATIASGKTWTASNGIVLGTTDVTLTNTDSALETAPTSGVENYKVVSVTGEGGTEYSLAVDGVIVDGEDGIIVTSDWLTDNGLSNATASDLTAARAAGENSNGYSYYACYALGLDPTKEEDKPEVRVTTDANGKFVITLTDKDGKVLDVADNVAVTLSVKTGTNPEAVTGEGSEGEIVAGEGTGEDQSFVIDPTKVESVKYYKVQINIRAK